MSSRRISRNFGKEARRDVRRTVGSVKQRKSRHRRLARIFLKIAGVELKCLRDCGAEVSVIDNEVLIPNPKNLGYLLSTEGIAPQHEYLDRIRAWPQPTTRGQLRAFLVYSLCFQCFLLVLLNMMSALNRPSQFSMDKGFVILAMELPLSFTPLLETMDLEEYICKSVSQSGAFLSESHKHWGWTDRESLAVKESVKKLSRFLWGWEFTAVTDHETLIGLFKKKEFPTKRQEKKALAWFLCFGQVSLVSDRQCARVILAYQQAQETFSERPWSSRSLGCSFVESCAVNVKISSQPRHVFLPYGDSIQSPPPPKGDQEAGLLFQSKGL